MALSDFPPGTLPSSSTNESTKETPYSVESAKCAGRCWISYSECNDQPLPPVVAEQCSKTQETVYNQYTQCTDNKDDCYEGSAFSPIPRSMDRPPVSRKAVYHLIALYTALSRPLIQTFVPPLHSSCQRIKSMLERRQRRGCKVVGSMRNIRCDFGLRR